MPKDILIYGRFDEYGSTRFFDKLNEIDESEDLVARVNTEGGEIHYGHGMVAKMKELIGAGRIKKVLVDGAAYSYGAWALLYMKEVEALDVSKFMFHRPGFSKWYEESERFDEHEKGRLNDYIKDFEKAFRAKVDVPVFEKITKVKLEDLLATDKRIDVFLSAKDALKCGLISSIRKISADVKAEVEASMQEYHLSEEFVSHFKVAAEKSIESENTDSSKNEKIKITDMKLSELKAQHPALYNEIHSLGVEAGVEQEKERAGAWYAYNEIDPEAVKVGIESGKALGPKAMAEFSVKALKGKQLGNIEADGKGTEVQTQETKEKSEKAKSDAAFMADVDKNLKVEA